MVRQDSTIAPELKESVKNTAPITIGASEKGEKGIEGSVGDFRIFNRVITRRGSAHRRGVAGHRGGCVERCARSSLPPRKTR